MSAKAIKPPKTKLTMKDKVSAGFVFFLGIAMLALQIIDLHNILFTLIGIGVIIKSIIMLIPNKDGTYDNDDEDNTDSHHNFEYSDSMHSLSHSYLYGNIYHID